MANKYTQIQTSEYVPQYVPAPVEQIGTMLSDARDRREDSQLGDARMEAAYRSAVGGAGTPEEREFAKSILDTYMPRIEERSRKGYSQQDLIRTQIEAEEAGAALNSLTTAKEQQSNWVQETRALNESMDTDELEWRLANEAPGIQYDTENLRAEINSTGPTKYADEVVYSEKADKYLTGFKDEDFYDKETGEQLIQRQINPRTGQIEISTPSGVTEERVIRALDQAFAGDSEVQRYKQRRQEYYTARAAQDPESLERLVASSPEESRPLLENRINAMKETGATDAEITGALLADNEIRNAQGFGATKHAFTDFNTDFMNPGRENALRTADQVNTVAARTKAFNNPMMAGMPENLVDPGKNIQKEIDQLRAGITISPHTGMPYKSDKNKELTAQIGELMIEKKKAIPEDTTMEQYAKSDVGKKYYGEALEKLVDQFPREVEAGETEEEYKDRINYKYQEKNNWFGSMRGTYDMYPDSDTKEKMSDSIIINRLSNRLGSIQNSEIYEVTAGNESGAVSLPDIAEMIGEDYGSEEFKDIMRENAVIAGEFKGTDPNIPSGYIMTITDPGGMFQDGHTREFKIASPEIQQQAIYEPMRQIAELGFDPRQYSRTVDIGQGTEVDFFAEDRYIASRDIPELQISAGDQVSPKTPGSQYRGKILGFWSEGEKVYEDSQAYRNFMKGLETQYE